MRKKGYIPEEAAWVLRIRNTAGIIALIGVGILGGFTLTNLQPGWKWLHMEDDAHSDVSNQK